MATPRTPNSRSGATALNLEEPWLRAESLQADEVPTTSGLYALQLRVLVRQRVVVGALGEVTLEPGDYVYVGSAYGPGGLRARVGRHLRGGAHRHWHIDYLRGVATVTAVRPWPGAARSEECALADAFASLPGAMRLVPHFGSSDCGCAGHLVHTARWPRLIYAPSYGWRATER